jgi:hypothetical protein
MFIYGYKKAAPIYADWSGFILFYHKHGIPKGFNPFGGV